MQTYRSVVALAATVLTVTGASAFAQELQVPQASPHARVEQRVGLTDFSVNYSSPGVKGRKIWGALVPLDQPWRTGANAMTKLVASRDFTFGDKKVAAGTYGLYTIPGKDTWTVVLNTAADTWGVPAPDPKNDVARITVKPQPVPMRERLTFLFSDTTDDSTRLDLEWEKVRVAIPLKVDTRTHVMASIDKVLGETWRPHFLAARYLLENNGDLKVALGYVDTSIANKSLWWNHWVRAQILSKQGKKQEALQAAQKVQELGKGDRVYDGFFKQDVEKAVADWSKKS